MGRHAWSRRDRRPKRRICHIESACGRCLRSYLWRNEHIESRPGRHHQCPVSAGDRGLMRPETCDRRCVRRSSRDRGIVASLGEGRPRSLRRQRLGRERARRRSGFAAWSTRMPSPRPSMAACRTGQGWAVPGKLEDCPPSRARCHALRLEIRLPRHAGRHLRVAARGSGQDSGSGRAGLWQVRARR